MHDFDYSEFHPLDHHIFDPYCWGWYGGVVQHIKLWWNYQFKAAPPGISHYRRWRCKQGYHDVTYYWSSPRPHPQGGFDISDPADGFMCYNCDWSRKL